MALVVVNLDPHVGRPLFQRGGMASTMARGICSSLPPWTNRILRSRAAEFLGAEPLVFGDRRESISP